MNTHHRYDDTDLILREYWEDGVGGDRSEAAIGRLNAVHGMYEKEISNADMLFTLAQFATAPAIWIDRSEDAAALLFARNRKDGSRTRSFLEKQIKDANLPTLLTAGFRGFVTACSMQQLAVFCDRPCEYCSASNLADHAFL